MSAHAYDRGGAPDGTLGISIDSWYGEDYVVLEIEGGFAPLTAQQTREVAADLLAHADALDRGEPASAHAEIRRTAG